jgi:predicted unusual protein kinase regulating ubiquinone biosynthesis (AarF/ABC1/UbiB family)
LSRYTAVATLLVKYGRTRLAGDDALAAVVPDADSADPAPDQLAADLEKLGPTFVKLGQLLSTRGDLLPQPYLDALSRLQDDVVPFSFEEVQEIVEAELSVRMSKAFSRFDEVPTAAASLGQVHRAALRDGRLVAVKIQRPGIVEQVRVDLEALQEVAIFLDKHSDAGHRYNVTGIVD